MPKSFWNNINFYLIVLIKLLKDLDYKINLNELILLNIKIKFVILNSNFFTIPNYNLIIIKS